MSKKASETPIVGLLPVMDPRIDSNLERQILDSLNLVEKIRELGAEVVCPDRAVSEEEDAVR